MATLAPNRQRTGPYRLPRDPRTDRGNLTDLATVGLAVRTDQALQPGGSRGPVPALVAVPAATAENLGGNQVGVVAQFTRQGRPALSRVDRFRAVQTVSPSVDSGPGPVLLAGTIRRDVAWPLVGGGGRGEFSATANARPGGPGRAFDVTAVLEYVISSVAARVGGGLSLLWPVAGVKPLIGQGPDATHRHRMLGRASGWPMVAPSVPSYGSRVPLLRPRGLVSQS